MSYDEVRQFVHTCSMKELEEIRKEVTKSFKKFPRETSQKKPPEKSDYQILHAATMNLCKSWFVEQPGLSDFYFDGKQCKGLSDIIDKIYYRYQRKNPGQTPKPEDLQQNFSLFCSNLPKFYADKKDLRVLSSCFEMIIQQIQRNIHEQQHSDPIREALKLNAFRRNAG